MYNDSYNDYIRSVLSNSDNNGIKYPEEDKSYYCDYSHPKNNMQQYERQENEPYREDYSNEMQNYNIMYSDYQNRFGMPNYYEYGDYPNGYNHAETRNNSEIEECYPEIYGIVYPMVQKACRNVTSPVTKADVEKMVEELYGSIEGNDEINLNITLNNNIDNLNSIQVEQNQRNTLEQNMEPKQVNKEIYSAQKPTRQVNRSTGLFKPNVEPKREVQIQPKIEQVQNERSNNQGIDLLEQSKQSPKETRFCNNGLCDIIRILLVRELLDGPKGPRPGPRPPFRPYPPFGPGPGPGPRPPFYPFGPYGR